LTHAGVEFEPLPDRHAFRIVASAKTTGQTGVEMEAMTAASVAALTVYDMVKAVDKGAVIESVRLLTKSGGKSGTYETQRKPVREAPLKQRGPIKASPQVLIHEAAAPRAPNASLERDALRKFMLAHHLRVSSWAKSAEVPVNELYGYLSGRSRGLSPASAERLAKAARATVEAMFGRKGAR
jgi:hypothetical protein